MTSWILRVFFLASLVDSGQAGRIKHVKKHGTATGPDILPSGNVIWDAKKFTTTDNGCQCLTTCSSNFKYHCSARPFCEVDPTCEGSKEHSWLNVREWFHSRNFDYCIFEPDTTYENNDPDVKLKRLTELLWPSSQSLEGLRNLKSGGPEKFEASGKFPSLIGVALGAFGESVSLSFDAIADVFPIKRTKVIHSVGVVGEIQWKSVGEHDFTGIFKGASGLIRLSSAKAPTTGEKGVHNPGAGLKFFRKGRPSANFVAMPSLAGQSCAGKNGNFFNLPFTNHIPYPADNFGLETIARKFWQASFCPLMIGLSDLASPEEGEHGTFPFELSLERSESAPGVEVDCEDYTNKLTRFADLELDQVLFDVYATSGPGQEKNKIAEIILKDKLRPSKFGDEELFFKHQRKEEDFQLEPQWLEWIQKNNPADKCGMKGVTAIPPSHLGGCGNLKKNAVAPVCNDRGLSAEEMQGCLGSNLAAPDTPDAPDVNM